MEKYFNDAIIGNKNMLVSFTKKGELIRLFYPTVDYRQFIDFFHIGVKVNDSNIIYLHKDINNEYEQTYVKDTNILVTNIKNTYFELNVTQTDFICLKENVLVKKYKFSNQNVIDLDVNLLLHSKILSDNNNDTSGFFKHNALIQYMHDYTTSIFSKEKIESVQINNTQENIADGIIGGKDYIGMSSDSSIQYHIGTLKPKEEKTIEIYFYITENTESHNINAIENEIEKIRKMDMEKEYQNVKNYWRKYVREHNGILIKEPTTKYDLKVEQIYKRSILLFPLLINSKTGGISSGVEIDENKTKCGRYSYCWPRDSIFITKAFDILKMEKETDKFYKQFCKNTQSKDGMWEQRFYTDGTLAPCWGYQIDETASVVYGVYKHYEHTLDLKFLKENLKMCEKAVEYLKKYTDKVLEGKEEKPLSYDLWEENEGIHTYSLAAIFASFETLIKIYDCLAPEFNNNRLKLENMKEEKGILEKYLLQIKEYIIKNFYSNEKKSFVRNKDQKMDISILGLVTPFAVFSPKEKKIENTIERINLTLRTYTGGYLRYEGDHYAGGNPWVIASLWLAQYYIEIGQKKKAKEHFDFVVKTASEHGYLAEQIDNQTLKPAWVIGLGWSHAMFINILQQLV